MKSFLQCVLIIFYTGNLSTQTLSFEQAWQQLVNVSDQLKAQDQELKRAEAHNDSAKSLRLPEINMIANYTYMEKPMQLDLTDLNPLASLDPASLPSDIAKLFASIPHSAFITPFTEQDIFTASLQALWPIYTGGKISAAQAIRKAQVTEQEAAFELAKRKLFTVLVERYYGIAVTKSLVDMQKKLVASLQKHLHYAQALENQGQLAKVERLNAEVAYANAKVSYGSAIRQHEIAVMALSTLLHEPAIETSSHLFVIPLSDTDALTELRAMTLKTHPALELLKAKETQAQGLISMEKSEYLPKLFFYGNYSLYKGDQLLPRIAPDWVVGAGVKVPIFSNHGRSGKTQAARSALLQAGFSRAQTQEDLVLLVDQSFRQLQQANEEVSALDVSIKLAEENLRLRQLSFNQGLSTSLEQVDAELNLTAVMTRQMAARYQYIKAYAHLMTVSGQLQKFINHCHLQEKAHAL